MNIYKFSDVFSLIKKKHEEEKIIKTFEYKIYLIVFMQL